MLNILLLGPQGAGKGTQAKRISEAYGIPHIATGDILRAAMAAGTELGRRVKPIYDSGQLVPDDLMIGLIRERLAEDDTENGFILDGFPRTLAQAEALDAMLREIGKELTVVFVLQLPEPVAIERLTKRAQLEGRVDDTPEAIAQAPRALPPRDRAARSSGTASRSNVVTVARATAASNEVFAEIQEALEQAAVVLIIRKSASEIEQMERAAQVVAETLELIGEHVVPGVTTEELDELAEEFIRSRGGVPTFKGYRGYPASICTSPNSMVVHGIPGPYTLRDGDVLSVDVGVTLGGFVGDSAYTFRSARSRTRRSGCSTPAQAALAAGIEQARPGNHLSDIGHAVQGTTEAAGFSVVRSLVGHGVGRQMHEDPQIPNFGEPGHGPMLQPGMTLAIEPMINAGGPDVYLHDDEWSISTEDESLSAHFEHTVAVTENGPKILTRRLEPSLLP